MRVQPVVEPQFPLTAQECEVIDDDFLDRFLAAGQTTI